jgi:long-chain acyl-CoA synthetase
MTASCLTTIDKEKEGSIGIPLPDMVFKICKPGTDKEVPYNTNGEICIAGPSVMKGYLKNEEETKETLKVHADGLTYIHTGDLGYQDEEGFVYYVQRLKRMIITNGYNIYPSQLENIIDAHDAVHMSCVIGVKDPIRMEKIKAFVVLKEGRIPNEETKNEIMEYLKIRVAKYSLPQELEFRKDLPKTLIGKIATRVLEEEEERKNNN